MNLYNNIFNNRRVLVTGHTGFKGSWLCLLLSQLGAKVFGYALEPPTEPSLYKEAKIDELVNSHIGDVRDLTQLQNYIKDIKPEIIIHMAAQPLVRASYDIPVETYSTNVMGTVNLLESCRNVPSLRAVVIVTTDKCYENREWHWGYREDEAMGGYDPYSNSKGCAELVVSSYRNSFFNPKEYDKHNVAIASARAGNVIGGGDWAKDRLITDFIKAISKGEKLKIRSPYSIRPWQHVLEPLNGYLTLASKLYTEGPKYGQAWNFGPEDSDAKNVEWISNAVCKLWGDGATYQVDTNPQVHEANYLKLDCSKAKAVLDWHPNWDIHQALKSIVEWNKLFINKDDIREVSIKQIKEFFKNYKFL